MASKIWKSLLPKNSHSNFFNSDLRVWIDSNIQKVCKKAVGSFSWQTVFSFSIWLIWNWRNKRIFQPDFTMPNNPKELILMRVQEWVESQRLEVLKPSKQIRLVVWSFPSSGWVKLNIDGSSKGNLGASSRGGLIRDDAGQWIVGFGINIGVYSVTMTELGLFFMVYLLSGLKVSAKSRWLLIRRLLCTFSTSLLIIAAPLGRWLKPVRSSFIVNGFARWTILIERVILQLTAWLI
ncbi:hypothetical protein L1049_022708 [Liquidambar formosana]|uniref:Uncharacterized protein n=1 Tax=Liquidambar formosana TaxID=63359 RepID=A0AAP0REY6_LIQFO